MNNVFPIKIISKQDQNLIEEFTFDQLDRAYLQAQYYEDLGLDIELIIPGAAESMALSLKVQPKDLHNLKQEFSKEIDSHNHL